MHNFGQEGRELAYFLAELLLLGGLLSCLQPALMLSLMDQRLCLAWELMDSPFFPATAWVIMSTKMIHKWNLQEGSSNNLFKVTSDKPRLQRFRCGGIVSPDLVTLSIRLPRNVKHHSPHFCSVPTRIFPTLAEKLVGGVSWLFQATYLLPCL